jgi:GTP pyrophosphokinase/guanosine-3',5'-bis(diphosphate) 3'-pyrophosphohydrolase
MIDISLGRKIASIVAKQLARLLGEQGAKPDAVTLTLGRFEQDETAPSQELSIDGSEGASVQLGPCCHPIPGDQITGYLGRGEGLVVHTQDCGVARRLLQRDSEHWIKVSWAEELTRPFEAAVGVLLRNGKGVLAQVAAAVGAAQADIVHIAMSDDAQGETAELKLLLSVRDRLHLADTLRILKRSPSTLRVWRIKP